MKRMIAFLLLAAVPASALVTGPSALKPGGFQLSLNGVLEGGKIEPHTDRASYQKARVETQSLSLAYGLGELPGFADVAVKIEAGRFSSGREEARGTVFYEADRGGFTGFEFNGAFVHEADRRLALVLRANPWIRMNAAKFSNSRLDDFGIGLDGSVGYTSRLFQRTFVYRGSGHGGQNPWLAVRTDLGYRLDDFVGRALTVSYGFFLESDLKDRFDERYDAVFSDPGERDRIRAMKYGNVMSAAVALGAGVSASLSYLEKQGGYDARATRVTSGSLTFDF